MVTGPFYLKPIVMTFSGIIKEKNLGSMVIVLHFRKHFQELHF